ncbi:MAG: response regulator [Spirochaetaceae bacterium]|jgi:CheY-like chemotaxis protein|nr:response regulator [Spirochaetaceae bacterium]
MDIKKNIVLAVDDMPEVLQCINSILQDSYDVRLAVNAASAQEVLKSTNVDLILLDVEMPGMSGLAFLEKLQKNETYKSIPVVFITSSSDDKVVKTAIKSGAKGYITKPFTPEALRESVEFFCL